MNIKEIVEGMTAPQVAQVIKDNFNEVDKDKANKTDLNKSISDLASVVEANKTDLTKKIDNNKEDTDEKLSELGSEVNALENSVNANRYGYNVTVNGLKGGVHTIKSAIKDVPSKFRMLGQKITFRTENGDWATYHNESLSLDNYGNVNDWVQEVGISSVQGDVNISNAPDYEDLTEAADGTIKFADKEYSKDSFSGLGRVYLRKNIVDGKNVLIQDMVSKANTIYIIQYDYDIQGKEITILEGCVLDFQGGSISNGVISGTKTFINSNLVGVFNNIQLRGSFANKELFVDWFGLTVDNPSIDCTPIIENLIILNTPIVFNAGTYYFSEFLIKNGDFDKVALIGALDYGLAFKTMFKPYYDNQRYVIKVGGGKDCFGNDGDAEVRGNNIKIEYIHFTGDLSKGNSENPLINKYGKQVEYGCSLLLLDRIQKGHFSISGKGLHCPFLTLGFIYECHFDNIISYNNEGKSNTPTIQIINNYYGGGLTAITIDRIMAEVNVGPLIKVCSPSVVLEMNIGKVFYEHTIQWSNSVPDDTIEYYTDKPDLSKYNLVPLFDLEGFGKIVIDDLILNEMHAIWDNIYDDAVDGKKKNIKTFVNFGTGINNSSLLINNIIENNSRLLFVSGGSAYSNHRLDVVRSEAEIIPVDGSYSTITALCGDISSSVELVQNYAYKNKDLAKLTIPSFIDYNVGFYNTIISKEDKDVVLSLPSSETIQDKRYIINNGGFKINNEIKYIVVKGTTQVEGYTQINAEFYDINGSIIQIDGKDFVECLSYGVYGVNNLRTFIIPTSVKNAVLVKLYHKSSILWVEEITAITLNNPIVYRKDDVTKSIKNALYYNSTEDLTYVSNGSEFVVRNDIYANLSTTASSASRNIVRITINAKYYLSGVLTFGSLENFVNVFISDRYLAEYNFEKIYYGKMLSKPTEIKGISYYDNSIGKYVIELTTKTSGNGMVAKFYSLESSKDAVTVEMSNVSNYNSDTCIRLNDVVIEGAVYEELPNNGLIGVSVFDKNNKKPVWHDGTKWVDAVGNEVPL